ncbi:hypothetical protein F2P56_000772 [Juglans regia]|uniref:Uncharacterized protein n=2 Tax=Juglans regia TaxID=51240 RepID=A0A834D3E7_JUGRE|nr:transcription factor MYB1-like [Juglans regia]KAF5479994.1 hypothetical protein F2P56_000772 [Juglans regia]
MEGTSLGVRKGAWTGEEDILLRQCIEKHGEGKWHQVPLRAGLNRCRKSCRLRWLNYLKPNIKRGDFAVDEVDLMIRLHKLLGNRWSLIAGRLPGRTPNDVKNYWNTHQRKKSISPIVDVLEEKEQNMIVKTKVIKPRPRTFCKKLTWLSGKPSTIIRERTLIQPKDDIATNIMSPTLTPSENRMKYRWECLLGDNEAGDEIATRALNTGFDEELSTTIWSDDEIASAAKVGGTFDIHDQDGFSFLANF